MTTSFPRPLRFIVPLACLALVGCGLFTTHRQPLPDPSSRIRVTRAEADEIDRWNAVSSASSAEHGCAYWKEVQSAAPDPSPRVDEYLQIRVRAACAAAERYAVAKARREREEAEHLAALRELATRERREGVCTEENAAMLQRWAMFIKDAMKLRFDTAGQPKLFSFVDQRLLVVDERGLQFQLGAWFGSELHVFVFGRLPVSVDARTSDGTPMQLASPYEGQVTYRCTLGGDCVMSQYGDPAAPEHRASRVALTGDRGLDVGVSGEGCVLIMAFSAT